MADTLLVSVKALLRITSSAFDTEIDDLISSARQDLLLSGVLSSKANSGTDALIKRAIACYVKAHFGFDNPDYDRLLQSYNMLKQHLCLAMDYSRFSVTFTVLSNSVAVEDAIITFNEVTIYTDSLGIAKFEGLRKQQNMSYTVSKSGYKVVTNTIDVINDVSVSIALVVA